MSGKNLLALSSILALSACGHYAPPESFEAKMARYQVHSSKNTVIPAIEPMAFKVSSGRGPASVSSAAQEDVNFSNKKLYFITLYRQYNQLASYSSNEDREITQCPNFHSAMVDHSEPTKPNAGWKANYETSKLNDDNYIRFYPELYLPVSDSSATPRVIDLLKQDHANTSVVQKAIDSHVNKTYAELAELCEYGSSDNYYAFENLHTEMKRRQIGTPGPKAMSVLLKTTVFSNKALIESLKRSSPKSSRAPASMLNAVDFDHEVMQRLGVPWANQYYQSLRQGP